MMNSRIKITLAIILLIVLLLPTKRVLMIRSDKESLMTDIDIDTTFDYTYIHSVSLTQVTETYVIHNHQLTLQKVLFQDQGAGLPQADSPDTVIQKTDDGFERLGPVVTLDTLTVFAQSDYKNRIIIHSNEILLSDMAATTHIRDIQIENVSLIYWLLTHLHLL